jgi:hypothetical protein
MLKARPLLSGQVHSTSMYSSYVKRLGEVIRLDVYGALRPRCTEHMGGKTIVFERIETGCGFDLRAGRPRWAGAGSHPPAEARGRRTGRYGTKKPLQGQR